MRRALALLALASVFPLAGFAAGPGIGRPVAERMDRDVAAGKPIVVHVVVALCDNRYQGIVPVPPAIGNGQDPRNNLYWGARYGVKTYLQRDAGWTVVAEAPAPDRRILERRVYRKTLRRNGRAVTAYLVADAWDGREIRAATERFLQAASGSPAESIALGPEKGRINVAAGGSAHVVAYVGHDGLMDFALPRAPQAAPGAPPRSSIVLACASRPYFAGHLQAGGSHPLLLTSGLRAPEAYTLVEAVEAWIGGKPTEEVRNAAAGAYHRFQKCGLKAAKKLFVTTP